MRDRRQMIRIVLVAVTCVSLLACAPRPATEAAESAAVAQAPYPTLLPFESLTPPPPPPPGLVAGLLAEGAALTAAATVQRSQP
ncbi:hypothetical protein OU426_10370 [Frigidibacter sp. RF13]|uniref:hypothetical protein n=1 Tax=Frigidibacter sp. RF13 TaxID=2997340 RepID=UPI00226ED31E|nr:hypothetical protein [Frigidibacter sp. RF13]MCY1127257.1 hypothetical protein [Frigidibacter sp. RF13]